MNIFTILTGLLKISLIIFREGVLPIIICLTAYFVGDVVGYIIAASLVIAWWNRESVKEWVREKLGFFLGL